MNNGTHLFVAIVVYDSTHDTNLDWAMVDLDKNHDHVASVDGEDAMDYYYGAFGDYFWNGTWWTLDSGSGGVSHGDGIGAYSTNKYVYEFSKPLNSTEAKDMALALGDVVGFRIELWDETTSDNYRYPLNTVDAVTSRWDEWADLTTATTTTTTTSTTTTTLADTNGTAYMSVLNGWNLLSIPREMA